MRAFLQRCEVRLSTVHRVATALLSGAGLMVLLPAIARDSIVSVIRTLVSGDLDLAHVCLLAAMVALLALLFAVFWLVLRDLTLFYFHALHVTHDGHDVFTPRFTLTGIRLPSDELGDGARRLDHRADHREHRPSGALERSGRDRVSIANSTPTGVWGDTMSTATSDAPMACSS